MTWITQASAARLLGKSPQWLRYHIKIGSLKAMKKGLRVFIDRAELVAFKVVDRRIKHGGRKKNP